MNCNSNILMLLKNGLVYAEGRFSRLDVAIRDSEIVAVGENLRCADAARTVDCSGQYVLPGLVDVHVHLREPGFSYKETIASGTRAAAHGGYTTVCSMPNLRPAPDSAESLGVQLSVIERDAVVNVVPYGTITKGQRGSGELADFAAMKDLVAGFSDDGCGVQSEETMREAMRTAAALGARIVAHCEVNELLRGGYIHDGDYCRRNGHKGICSRSEWEQVARDIALVEQTGCAYHVCHISTKESVALIREAKAKGLPVTCETAPHYLVLCDEDLREEGRFKMNPPLRSAEDRAALIEGVKDGTIDMVATDHAPHSAEEKSRGLAGSAMGVVGLESAFAVLYTELVLGGVITLERLVALFSTNARRIFGFGGSIEVGQKADLVVMDLNARTRVNPDEFLSQGRATPFEGREVRSRVVMTICGGRVVYEDKNTEEK